MTAAELVSHIRSARESQGLTQADAAKSAGIKQPTWHQVERGRKSVRPETLLAMAAAVGLSARHVPERFELAPKKNKKNTRKAIDADSR